MVFSKRTSSICTKQLSLNKINQTTKGKNPQNINKSEWIKANSRYELDEPGILEKLENTIILLWALSMRQEQLITRPVLGLGTFRSVMFIYSTLQTKNEIWNSHWRQKLFMKAKIFKSDLNSSIEAAHIKVPWKLPPFIWFACWQLWQLTSQSWWLLRDVKIKHTKMVQEMFIHCRNHLEAVLHSGNLDRCCNQQTVPRKRSLASQCRVTINANMEIHVFLNRRVKTSLHLIAWRVNLSNWGSV